jgi:Cu(I)/Ag(I) efflux system membrane protein CusA/SilA
VYSRWDRSPDIVEDQVSYPIITALLGAPKVKAIRGYSDFGYSFVYVIFEDGTDIYWARTRVLEYLSKISSQLPAGVKTELGPVKWSGQYENMLRVKERLKLIVPFTLVLIFGLLYLNTKSGVKAAIVMLAVPFSAVGAIWLLYLLGYNISIAVWVGLIALLGLDAETDVFMLFLDLTHDEAKAAGRLRTTGDLTEAIIHGAVKRVRPKAMTVCAAFIGLLPIMWSTGTGADVMKRIAAPMVGGLVTSFGLELLVYPAIYYLWRRKHLVEGPMTAA